MTAQVAEGTQTITERVADHVVGLRYEDLPDAIIEKAKPTSPTISERRFWACAWRTDGRRCASPGARGWPMRDRGRHATARCSTRCSPARCSCTVRRRTTRATTWDRSRVVTNPVAWAFSDTAGISGSDLLAADVVGCDVNMMGSPRVLVATALVDRHVNLARFDEPPDQAILATLAKVILRYEPGRPLLYARIDIATSNGNQYSAEGEALDVSSGDWGDWLAATGRDAVDASQLERLIGLLRHLEDVADVADVMAYVIPGAPS